MRIIKDVMLSVRVTPEERKRVKDFAAEIIRTNPYLTEADVLRELIGLKDTGLITPAMRKRLRSDQPIPAQPFPAETPLGGRRAIASISSKRKGGKK